MGAWLSRNGLSDYHRRCELWRFDYLFCQVCSGSLDEPLGCCPKLITLRQFLSG